MASNWLLKVLIISLMVGRYGLFMDFIAPFFVGFSSPVRLFTVACTALVMSTGCGNDVISVTAPADDATSSSSAAVGVGGGGAGGSGGSNSTGVGAGEPGAVIDCEAACAVEPDGGCHDPSICEEQCDEQNGEWIESTADAFTYCAQNEPLCFETMEQCMWRTLYPDGTDVTVELSAADLFPLESQTIYAKMSENNVQIHQAVVDNGSLEIDLAHAGQLSFVSGVLLFVDENSDGVCTDGELSAYVMPLVSPPFHAPTVEAVVQLSDFSGNSSFCQFF